MVKQMVKETKPGNAPSARAAKLKKAILEGPIQIDTERLKFLMEIYRGGDGEIPVIRRAKLYDKILREKTIYIDDNPIVGTVGRWRAMVYPYPEWSCNWMPGKESIDRTGKKQKLRLHIGGIDYSEEDARLVKEAVDYWSDKCVTYMGHQSFQEAHPDENLNGLLKSGIFTPHGWTQFGTVTPDWAKLLAKGLNGIIAEVEEQRRQLKPYNLEAYSKIEFYKAMLMCLKAVRALAQRYASLAKAMAQSEKDQQRRQELERIAETLEWVPANPARSFYEAVQSFWFVDMAVNIEDESWAICPGRFGLFMYPFYEKDVSEGRMTREQALELLEFLFIKHLEIGVFTGPESFKANSGQTGQAYTIGGLTADGKDATNEIDWLLLETQSRMRLPQPHLSLFWHNQLSEEFLLKVVDLFRTGIGQPQLFNNDVLVARNILAHGCSMEEARLAHLTGCIMQKLSNSVSPHYGSYFNLAKTLELALNNGQDPVTGEQIGLKTGEAESFASYEEFYEAVFKQIGHLMPLIRQWCQTDSCTSATHNPFPFQSAFVDDCIKTGQDIMSGGARYISEGLLPIAGIDLGNSLAAIKKLVYEDKKITMKELKAVLKANFKGYEEIQKMCLDAPKYGNNDPYVDSIVRQCYDRVYEIHQSIPNVLGRRGSRPEVFSVSTHNYAGYLTGALPTGRPTGISLCDASVSAMPGTDRKGPTALAISAAGALDTVKNGSNHLNMRFHPSAMEGREGARKLLALIKTYMDLGGSHIQFNCVSTETLKDAQRHPEKYRDLVVRVAGFSAFFIQLDIGVQDQIILRTELKFD